MDYIFRGKAIMGEAELDDPFLYHKWLENNEGAEIELILRKRQYNRSVDQNKLYWHYLGLISDHTGQTPDELHKIYKTVYLNNKSTSSLDTKQFAEYLEKIERHSAELNVKLPKENQIDLG